VRIGALLGSAAGFPLVTLLAVSGAATASGSATTAAAVAVGVSHTCALTSAGGVKCWGDNYNGELGDGTVTERHDPVDVSGLRSGVQAIATGDYFSCALTDPGGVKCWGHNDFGQLGDRTTRDRHTPVGVAGLSTGVAAIAAGSTHACALTSAGAVRCWGYNGFGALGNGTTTVSRSPAGVTGLASGVTAITTGLDYTCALTGVGGVKCWGDNGFGKLGDGTATNRYTPADVSGLSSGVMAVSASDALGHTCAVTSGGAVKCWGDNAFGELGDGSTNDHYTPVDVSGLASGTVSVSAGGFYTCAIVGLGRMTCWGDNSDGALGDGTRIDRFTPVDVSGLSDGVVSMAAGLSHTCAVTSAGVVRCWGDNAFGELGDGTTTDRLAPVTVGLQTRCVVPDVVGKLLAPATAAIRKAHCRTGAITRKLSSAKSVGRVLAQKPRAGARLVVGARVNLTVGRGPR
jgi:alpha-tubulin suppressor-like RCC1 family protein